jgi:hypothetical protein
MGEEDNVTLSVDINGLVEGTYNCELIISDPNAGNSPQVVAANLRIYSPWPGDSNGLVSWWEFGEGEGTTAYDSVGGNDGTIYGADWTNGMIGGALSFDGVDDYVDVGNDSSLKPALPVALSAWINLSSLGNHQYVMALDDQTDLYYGIWWYVGSAGNLAVGYGDGGTRATESRRGKVGTTVLDTDTWYHIAAVVRGRTDMSLYVDGVDDGGTYSGTGGSIDYSNADSLIGMRHDFAYCFDGRIDDVLVYERAASVEEIWEVYQLILGERPGINVWPDALEFYANEGSSNPASQTIFISNIGANTLNWRIAEDCNWLEVEPNSGSSVGETDEIALSVDISGLTGGWYDCNVVVSDPNAFNSPQIVSVILHVYDSDNELYVPSEYATIQAGIDAAAQGATVVVAPGIYTGEGNRDLDFLGKAITVRSFDPEDPRVVAATVIDCEDSGRGFYFHSGEGPNSVVAGLTITNGYVYGDDANGGGICCVGASPTIENCVITNCTARGRNGDSVELHAGDAYGGGIFCASDSSARILGCTVIGNRALGGIGTAWGFGECGRSGDGYGGGICCVSNSNATITSCKISDNEASGQRGISYECMGFDGSNGYGGGICFEANSNAAITDCEISNNRAVGGDGMDGSIQSYTTCGGDSYGAGICIRSGSEAIIEDCNVSGNSASGGTGGGEHWRSGADGGGAYGAGIYCGPDGTVDIKRCKIRSNSGSGGDGGWNNGIVEGSGGSGGICYGGGLFCSGVGESSIKNCIVLGNTILGGDGGYGISAGGDGGNAHGGGVYLSSGTESAVENCTIVGSTASGGTGGDGWEGSDGIDGSAYGWGIYCDGGSQTVNNCILWYNDGNDVEGSGYSVTYSCTEQVISGTGNIHTNPLFVTGPEGDYYLSQVAAGQAFDSPCVDAGSDTAAALCIDECTTRTDEANDAGIVDMGYHYGDCNCGLNVADIDGDLDVDLADYALFAADYAENSMTIPRGSVWIDGILSEWSENVEWVALDKIYDGSPNDVEEAWFALQWDGDANKVYAAVIVYDSNHVFSDEYVSWDASDRLEVYSQGDAAGGTGWYGIYDVAQHYFVGPNTVGGSWGSWPGGAEPNEDVELEHAVIVDGEQIIYEIGVKQFDNYGGFSGGDSIVTELDVGDVVGFDLVVSTRWSGGFGMLSENLMTGKYLDAGQFARYMLVEEAGGPPCFERVGDLDGNCAVNWADLAILVESWLWEK